MLQKHRFKRMRGTKLWYEQATGIVDDITEKCHRHFQQTIAIQTYVVVSNLKETVRIKKLK